MAVRMLRRQLQPAQPYKVRSGGRVETDQSLEVENALFVKPEMLMGFADKLTRLAMELKI